MSNTIAIMMKNLRQTVENADPAACLEPMEGTVTQVEGFRSVARFGNLEVGIDEPVSFAGTGTAPNPAEIAMAGLCASVQVTLLCYASFLSIDVGNIEIKVSGALDARGFFGTDPSVPVGFYDVNLHISFTGKASAQALKRLFAQVEQCCPVLAVFRQPMKVNLSYEQKT